MLPFERQVLDALLAGDDPYLTALRDQLSAAQVERRTTTDEGFFLDLTVPGEVAAEIPNLMIDDVGFQVHGLEEPTYCVLWVRSGRLDQLECYGGHDHWPEFPVVEHIFYLEAIQASTDTWKMVPTAQRHLPSLLKRWRLARGAA
jgi:hypothetical protein